MKVAIIGGGVIGLSLGWQLARQNFQVNLFDQGCCGKQASWVAAGMLSPFWELNAAQSGLIEMGQKSLELYPRYLKELAENSLHAVSPENQGMLCVAMDRDDRAWLERHYQHKKMLGLPVEWKNGDEARVIEPLLSPKIHGAIWIKDEQHINNRLLIQALIEGVIANEGQIFHQVKITEIRHLNGVVKGVTTDNHKSFDADVVINTAGAWGDGIQPSISPNKNQIRPIKGQILSLKMPSNLFLKHTIRSPKCYLCPKKEGIMRLGASSEDVGFDTRIIAGVVSDLLEEGKRIVPAIREYELTEVMCGFRPVATNIIPLIGPAELRGLFQAIGHGRSGILLAPYTAYTLLKMIKEYVNEN